MSTTAQHLAHTLQFTETLCGLPPSLGNPTHVLDPDQPLPPILESVHWCRTCLSSHPALRPPTSSPEPDAPSPSPSPVTTAPLTTADVDRFLHQLDLDRARPYWADRTTQLDGVQSWLESLRDHLNTGPHHATPTRYDADLLTPTYRLSSVRAHCAHEGCTWWVETGSHPSANTLLRRHRHTDHGDPQ